MPPDQLPGDRVQRVFDAEEILFRGHLGKEDGLEQQIAKLAGQLPPVAGIDGVHHLVRLFEKKRLDGVERLLAVPGTTTRSAQAGHQIDQELKFFTGGLCGHQRGAQLKQR